MKIKTPLVVDVSWWERDIDWSIVEPKPIIAICRSVHGDGTRSTIYLDPVLGGYFAQWEKLGILRGSYLFPVSSKPIYEQCAAYIDRASEIGLGELPPILDIEDRNLTLTQVRNALDILEEDRGTKLPVMMSSGVRAIRFGLHGIRTLIMLICIVPHPNR